MLHGSYAGFPLRQIRDDELWREGGFESWNHYCESFLEASRGQINRVIRYATMYHELAGNEPPLEAKGGKILPTAESQTRPLLKLPDAKQRAKAWKTAVKRAGDALPTAKIVMEVVTGMLGDTPSKAKPSRGQHRLELISSLREEASSQRSWSRILELIEQLETLESGKSTTT